MRLLKGNLWELAVHSPVYWEEVLRDKNNPPIIPYFAYKKEMPYEPFEKHGEQFKAMGTYFYPFVIRYFKRIR